VGSGRDRKNEEKLLKCESNLVLAEAMKKESGLFLIVKYYVIKFLYKFYIFILLESNISIINAPMTSISNYDRSTDIMTFSTNDSEYNLWTSYVWEPVYGLSTKNSNP